MSQLIRVEKSWDGLSWVNRHGTDDSLARVYSHEPFMFPLLSRLSGPDSVFVDVGAHVGRYAVRMAKRIKQVYALEPHPKNFEGLLRNIYLNGTLDVIAMDVGASDARKTITSVWNPFPKPAPGEPIADFAERMRNRPESDGDTGKFEFKADRLDELIPVTPTLVLIDVEGAEMEVIDGMTKFLPSHPVLIVEVHEFRVSLESMKQRLRKEGYDSVEYLGHWGFPVKMASKYLLAQTLM